MMERSRYDDSDAYFAVQVEGRDEDRVITGRVSTLSVGDGSHDAGEVAMDGWIDEKVVGGEKILGVDFEHSRPCPVCDRELGLGDFMDGECPTCKTRLNVQVDVEYRARKWVCECSECDYRTELYDPENIGQRCPQCEPPGKGRLEVVETR